MLHLLTLLLQFLVLSPLKLMINPTNNYLLTLLHFLNKLHLLLKRYILILLTHSKKNSILSSIDNLFRFLQLLLSISLSKLKILIDKCSMTLIITITQKPTIILFVFIWILLKMCGQLKVSKMSLMIS
jgi:hypothetical protein